MAQKKKKKKVLTEEQKEINREKSRQRYIKKKAEREAFAREHPDRIKRMREITLQRMRNKWIRYKNVNKPEQSYYDTYWKIILSSNATHPLLESTKEAWEIDFDEVLNQLNSIRKTKNKLNRERRSYLKKAWELDLPVKDYIDTIKNIDAQKEEEQKKEQSLRDFLIGNISSEELKERIEIQKRLEELNKIYPRYNPDEESTETHEYIIKEIKHNMAKISFDKGKTYLDILNDRDNNIILSKIVKKKVWDNVIDAFDADAMMTTLEKMSANERKMCTQANNANNRMLYLGKYLLEATEDLIV